MNEQKTNIDALLDSLDERIEPSRDLWPSIESQLPQRGSGGGFWQWRVAASVMLTAIMIGALGVPRGDLPNTVATLEIPTRDAEALRFAGFDAQFVQVREQSLDRLADQLGTLPPGTQGVILGNLQIIRDSIADINEAIEREPNNVELRQLLQIAYRQEFAIVSTVHGSAATIEQMEPGI